MIRLKHLVTGTVMMAALIAALPLYALMVGDIRLARDGARTLIKVSTDALAEPVVEGLDGKVLVKIPSGKRIKVDEIKLTHPVVAGLRFGQHDNDLHLVIDLVQGAKASLGKVTKAGFEVALQVEKKEKAAPAAAAADKAEATASSLDPALAGYTYRLVDVSLTGDGDRSEVVLTTDGPASYKPLVKDGGKTLGVIFKNCSLAWSGDPATFTDVAVDGVKVRSSQVKGESQVQVDIALSEKLTYTLTRDQNQVILRIQRPEREASNPKRGDLDTLVTLEVEDADVVGVVKNLCQEVGFDYQITKVLQGQLPPASLVTFKATKRPLREVLDSLLVSYNCSYLQEGNTLYIGGNSEIDEKRLLLPTVQKFYSPSTMTVDQLIKLLQANFKRDKTIPVMAADPRDKQRLMVVGGAQDVAKVMAAIAKFDVPELGETAAGESAENEGGNKPKTQVFKLQYIDGSGTLLSESLAQLYPTKADATENLSMVVDTSTRTLVVTTQLKYLRKIERLLARLDVRPPQVNIEGRIVEMQQGSVARLGLNWTAMKGTFPNELSPGQVGEVGQFNAGISSLFTSQLRMSTVQGGYSIFAALDAMVQDDKARILSSPNITTNDNIAAIIETSENIIVTTLKEDIVNGTISRTITEQEYPIPLKLAVTPRISMADKKILMKVIFTLKTPTGLPGATGIRANTSQLADTQVTVSSGETAVMGGLVKESNQATERKVPILGDIPLLGMLFKYKSSEDQKREVVIFITPTIVED